jgi:hypothetical protein
MAVFAIKGYVAQEVIDLCSSDFGILEHYLCKRFDYFKGNYFVVMYQVHWYV